MNERTVGWQSEFLRAHQLDENYLQVANQYFSPLATSLTNLRHNAGRPVLVALHGSQGSGKSTLSDYLVADLASEHQLSAVSLSLDDFYYTHSERKRISQTIHPLLLTRGVPGTHDISLLNATLGALLEYAKGSPVAIPRFDKSEDDRRPETQWDTVTAPVDIIILEGWCMGAEPQNVEQLASPINALEQYEDIQGIWRSYVNHILGEQFLPLYQRVDQWLMLQAPGFDCVHQWRCEQEHKLADRLPPGSTTKLMNDDQIARFIQHYQRITEQCLIDLPDKVHYLFRLDKKRQIVTYRQRND